MRCDWSKRLMPNRQNPRPLAIASPDTDRAYPLAAATSIIEFCANSQTALTSRAKRCRTITSNSPRCPLDEPAVQLQGAPNKRSVSPSSVHLPLDPSHHHPGHCRLPAPCKQNNSSLLQPTTPIRVVATKCLQQDAAWTPPVPQASTQLQPAQEPEQSADRVVATDCAQPAVHLAPCNCA